MSEEIDCFVPNDRMPENTRAGVTGYSGRSTTSTTGYAAKRWSDDPWSALTTGEAEAWRAGWRDALVRIRSIALMVEKEGKCRNATREDAMAVLVGQIDRIADMEPHA